MTINSPLLALLLAAVLVLPGLMRAASRAWTVLFLAALALALALPALLPGDRLIGSRWIGPLLALAGVLFIGGMLSRRAGLTWREMGFTWAQRPGSLRAGLWVSAAALVLNAVAMSASTFRLPGVAPETWLYQATLPGLVEESIFRGVLLALLDRAFTARKEMFGASIGWGGATITLVFLALHGVTVGTLIGVLPAALLYLWLRARTGGLVLPIVVHNLWNLSVHAAHL